MLKPPSSTKTVLDPSRQLILRAVFDYVDKQVELSWYSRQQGRTVFRTILSFPSAQEVAWRMASEVSKKTVILPLEATIVLDNCRKALELWPITEKNGISLSRILPDAKTGRPLPPVAITLDKNEAPQVLLNQEVLKFCGFVILPSKKKGAYQISKIPHHPPATLFQAKVPPSADQAIANKTSILPAPLAPSPPPVTLSVTTRVELPDLSGLAPGATLNSLTSYLLREKAALWWVSNQTDDLLCLPYCRVERLEYQIRTALRVLGPLRGRALLSDEVGLGKTIEAGLVIKEYLTRGMIKRFLVLTVPSLVDQWEEELSDKFQLPVVTTNHPDFRSDPDTFWQQDAIVASLHTFKQTAHLARARGRPWDLLIIDEAHHLRNRSSQAWEAVNGLPRQFLLLLTATPVQNSLEELYNLVTLLQPGQRPSPREFRQRYLDPKRPHQPREPEELRRLLGQVMIRNTRANSGIDLPPRRAETVLFELGAEEKIFWKTWEAELREALKTLNPGQASLWGRLLLQSAGSSPAAWKSSVASFPDKTASHRWLKLLPPSAESTSWQKRCQVLEPLAKGEGGVVIFTQYLQTQRALAEHLKAAGIPCWVINGQTPAPDRQPISQSFRAQGGALLLTHSGTEGRNLQFCHRLVNMDLPWNPMEIEQRIGRLHRLGQKHPVRIYNLVQAESLQAHLLEILQEKLNLFELVVGETGLVLGERLGSEEFAEEVFRRWQESTESTAETFRQLGEELAQARSNYAQVKELDQTLFAQDYETL